MTKHYFRELEQNWFKMSSLCHCSFREWVSLYFVSWQDHIFQYNPYISICPHYLNCAPQPFRHGEQLIWIIPLDLNHIFVPIDSFHFRRWFPFFFFLAENEMHESFAFSLSFYHLFQMLEHLCGCIARCSVLLVWAVWYNRRDSLKNMKCKQWF